MSWLQGGAVQVFLAPCFLRVAGSAHDHRLPSYKQYIITSSVTTLKAIGRDSGCNALPAHRLEARFEVCKGLRRLACNMKLHSLCHWVSLTGSDTLQVAVRPAAAGGVECRQCAWQPESEPLPQQHAGSGTL